MMDDAQLLFQLGSIMLLAFIAATIAGKVNQTVMIGYIVIGILIGPYISISLFGFEYNGLIQDTSLIMLLSQVGLIMLMFFVGLEFSFSKLKRVRTPAVILAVIDTSVGLFVGFLFASVLGWPLIDSIFLAGVIAMSSTSIAMKILFDLKRMSSPEVEFLIGLVVVETFIAMLILTVASGMIVNPDSSPTNYGQLILGMAAFYAFFVWLAMWAVPRIVRFFDKIENDELFILFALGVVFLTAGMASVMGVPPIIGAFFIGMILAESKVSARVQSKLESFKDAFVAIFFISFGMMIDPAVFGSVIWIVLGAVVIVVVYEAMVMSAVSYFLGFSSKASATVGTSLCGRGVESILYASVGSRVQGATMGAQLNAFGGVFCFVISAITPMLVKHSAKFAMMLSNLMPRSLKFSGSIVSRTLGKITLPSGPGRFRGAKATTLALAAFVGASISVIATDGILHVILFMLGLAIVLITFFAIRVEISDVVSKVNYTDLGVMTIDRRPIVNLVAGLVLGTALAVLMVVFVWTYAWQASLVVMVAYLSFDIGLMVRAYKSLHPIDEHGPPKIYTLPRADAETSDPVLDIPKPVYGAVRPAPSDIRL